MSDGAAVGVVVMMQRMVMGGEVGVVVGRTVGREVKVGRGVVAAAWARSDLTGMFDWARFDLTGEGVGIVADDTNDDDDDDDDDDGNDDDMEDISVAVVASVVVIDSVIVSVVVSIVSVIISVVSVIAGVYSDREPAAAKLSNTNVDAAMLR